MTSKTIVPNVLGATAERALMHDVAALTSTLRRLDADAWHRSTPVGGAPVATVTAHLAEGAARLAAAWRARVDAEENEALLHTFDDPEVAPEVEMDTSDPDRVLAAYVTATSELRTTLGALRQDDWSWPVWSPLGGLETLAEAVRRTLAHHHVHASDVARGLGLRVDPGEDVTRLVTEFVLDALARRGGQVVSGPPLVVQVVTDPPGAGTWSLILGEEERPTEVHSVYEAFVGAHPESRPRHRVERGAHPSARVTLRGGGEDLWRAAFRRGGSWDELDVHGDDAGRELWSQLLDHAMATPRGLGRVQH